MSSTLRSGSMNPDELKWVDVPVLDLSAFMETDDEQKANSYSSYYTSPTTSTGYGMTDYFSSYTTPTYHTSPFDFSDYNATYNTSNVFDFGGVTTTSDTDKTTKNGIGNTKQLKASESTSSLDKSTASVSQLITTANLPSNALDPYRKRFEKKPKLKKDVVSNTVQSSAYSSKTYLSTDGATASTSSVSRRRLESARQVAKASSDFGSFWVDAAAFDRIWSDSVPETEESLEEETRYLIEKDKNLCFLNYKGRQHVNAVLNSMGMKRDLNGKIVGSSSGVGKKVNAANKTQVGSGTSDIASPQSVPTSPLNSPPSNPATARNGNGKRSSSANINDRLHRRCRIKNNRYDRDVVLQAIDDLFDVSEEQKRINVSIPGASVPRGYIGFGKESGSKENFENKEGFAFGYSNWTDEKKPSNDMEGYNVWPPEQKTDFTNVAKQILEKRLFDMLCKIGEVLVRAYSLVLYNDENVLAEAWKGGETMCLGRIFRYFEDKKLKEKKIRKSKYEQVLGSSAHTDWGLLTLIVADDCPGLQLHIRRDKWDRGEFMTVRPRFDQNLILVNCGDFMSLLSNGKFLSPLHRVLSPGEIPLPPEGIFDHIGKKNKLLSANVDGIVGSGSLGPGAISNSDAEGLSSLSNVVANGNNTAEESGKDEDINAARGSHEEGVKNLKSSSEEEEDDPTRYTIADRISSVTIQQKRRESLAKGLKPGETLDSHLGWQARERKISYGAYGGMGSPSGSYGALSHRGMSQSPRIGGRSYGSPGHSPLTSSLGSRGDNIRAGGPPDADGTGIGGEIASMIGGAVLNMGSQALRNLKGAFTDDYKMNGSGLSNNSLNYNGTTSAGLPLPRSSSSEKNLSKYLHPKGGDTSDVPLEMDTKIELPGESLVLKGMNTSTIPSKDQATTWDSGALTVFQTIQERSDSDQPCNKSENVNSSSGIKIEDVDVAGTVVSKPEKDSKKLKENLKTPKTLALKSDGGGFIGASDSIRKKKREMRDINISDMTPSLATPAGTANDETTTAHDDQSSSKLDPNKFDTSRMDGSRPDSGQLDELEGINKNEFLPSKENTMDLKNAKGVHSNSSGNSANNSYSEEHETVAQVVMIGTEKEITEMIADPEESDYGGGEKDEKRDAFAATQYDSLLDLRAGLDKKANGLGGSSSNEDDDKPSIMIDTPTGSFAVGNSSVKGFPSNGSLKESPPTEPEYRRKNLIEGERRSIVFFFYPGYESKIPQTDDTHYFSIFQDQSPNGQSYQKILGNLSFAELKEISFGKWIRHKWESVKR